MRIQRGILSTIKSCRTGLKETRIQANKNIDSDLYHNLFCEEGGVYDMIEAKMSCLAGNLYFIQQDGAHPHTAHGTIEELVAGGTGNGFVPIILTRSPNSPDLNINDLDFYASLMVDVKRICTHCSRREKMMVSFMRSASLERR